MKRLTFILISVSTLSACGESSVNIDGFISNKQAEENLLKLKKDSDSVKGGYSYFFQTLSERPAPDFNWTSLWTFMNSNGIRPAASDETAWRHFYSTQKHFCSNGAVFEKFISFNNLLRSEKFFSPFELGMDHLADCLSQQSDGFKLTAFTKELSSRPVSWKFVQAALSSLDAGTLESQVSEQDWESLSSQLITALQLHKKIPDDATRTLTQLYQKAQLSPRLTGKMKALTSISDASAALAMTLPPYLQVLSLHSRMKESQNDALSFLAWWRSYSGAIQAALEKNELSWNEFFNRQQEVIEASQLLSPAEYRVLIDNFESLIETFDDMADAAFAWAQRSEGQRSKLELSVSESKVERILQLWFHSLLFGMSPLARRNEVPLLHTSHNILEAWIAHRISLRNILNSPLEDLLSVEGNDRIDKNWWGDENECPIPTINKASSTLIMDRSFVDASNWNPDQKRGCVKISSPSQLKAVSESYDILVYGPSVDVDLTSRTRNIVDLSGKAKPRFAPPTTPHKNGLALPFVFASTSSGGRYEWFVFYYFLQNPEREELVSNTVSDATPPAADSGGSLTVRKVASLPLWIRSFGAPPTQGHLALQVGAAMTTTHLERMKLRSGLKKRYPGYDLELTNDIQTNFTSTLKSRLLEAGRFRPLAESMDLAGESSVYPLSPELSQAWALFLQSPDWAQQVTEQLNDILASSIAPPDRTIIALRFDLGRSSQILLPSPQGIPPGVAGSPGETGRVSVKSKTLFFYPQENQEAKNDTP